MVETYGRVISTSKSGGRIELDSSGQIINFGSGNFLIGDPVAIAIENGEVLTVKRVSKKFIRSSPEHEGLGAYWRRK